MSYPEAIETIKQKASDLKLSQVELANASGISAAYISRLFKLEREASDQILMDLARAVKLPPLEILHIAKRLPVEPSKDETLYRIEHLYHTLREPSSKLRALEFFEFLAQQEDKSDRKSKKTNPQKS